MKFFAEDIAPILTFIFQQSLDTGTVPSDWRLANISPIFKKGDRSKASNYRPVSITSICSKLLEHVIFSNIMDHCDENNILNDVQHGFRPGHSCETQLIITSQDVAHSLDQKEQVDAVALDFSKAFDRVPHNRLLHKLHHYGIHDNLIRWIRVFLTERLQRVVVDGESSEWVPVTSGVPQGTVLGPLLFISFINDIVDGISSKIRLFADDCLLYRPITDVTDSQALQQDLNRLHSWANTWQMKFNIEKCYHITFSLRRKAITTTYTLGDTPLALVTDLRYLGLTFSSNLSWQGHMNNITSRANRMLGLVSRNLRKTSQKIRQQAYFSLVRPHLEYCCSVWNPHKNKHISKIEAVQRRAARFTLQRYRRMASVSAMIQHLKWESLERRRNAASLHLMYKIQNNTVAINAHHFTAPMIASNTRQYHSKKLLAIPSRTQLYQNSFFPRTVTAWNALSKITLDATSLEGFKGALPPSI